VLTHQQVVGAPAADHQNSGQEVEKQHLTLPSMFQCIKRVAVLKKSSVNSQHSLAEVENLQLHTASVKTACLKRGREETKSFRRS
jgi:hypothetical protein